MKPPMSKVRAVDRDAMARAFPASGPLPPGQRFTSGVLADDGLIDFPDECLRVSPGVFRPEDVQPVWPSSSGALRPSDMDYGHVQNCHKYVKRQQREVGIMDHCRCHPPDVTEYEGPCLVCPKLAELREWEGIFLAELRKRDRARAA